MSKIKVGIFHSHPVDHEVPLFRALSNQAQIDLTVFYFSDYGANKSINTFGLKNIPYGNSPLEGYSYRFLKNYGSGENWKTWSFINPEIFKIISRDNLDVVVLYGYAYISTWMVIAAASFNKVPILFRGEGESILTRSGWKLSLRNFILPKLYNRFNGFLGLGRANEKHYQSNGVSYDRITRVPQSIDQSFVQLQPDQSNTMRVRRKYGFDEETILFVYVHKHRAEKRPMDVIKAFCEQDPNLNTGLLMLSDGPLRKESEEYVNEHDLKQRVRFTGYLPFEEMILHMLASDVLVVTSGEPVGVVLYQSLACGLAILTSDKALGWLDAVKPGINGLIFQYKWLDSLFLHMRTLAENRILVEKMKSHSKEISKDFSIEKSVSGTFSAILKCISECSTIQVLNENSKS